MKVGVLVLAIVLLYGCTGKEEASSSISGQIEQFTFRSDYFSLAGDLRLPGTDGEYPVIIMVHGDGGINRTDLGKYIPIMERFLRAGFAVCSWDKPGTGGSSGEFENGAAIITDRASILLAGINFLMRHPHIDSHWVGVWGISQGGYVIPKCMTLTDNIAFMIVVSGPGEDSIDQFAYLIGQQVLCAGHPEEDKNLAQQSFAGLARATTYQEYLDNWLLFSSVEVPESLRFSGRDLIPEQEWRPWNSDGDSFFNPIDVIVKTHIPVLAFFGERDTQVDPIQGVSAYRTALQTAGNQNFRVELIPAADHSIVLCETGCMDERDNRSQAGWLNYAPEYLNIMEEWLMEL